MATVSSPDPSLDIREQLARIDKMQAELHKNQFEINKLTVDARRVELDTRLAPWALVFTGVGAGAAIFAAGAAFTKLFLH